MCGATLYLQATQHFSSGFYLPSWKHLHVRQADSFIRFCDNYGLQFIDPAPYTLTYYIAHLSSVFASPKCLRNNVSGAQFLHKLLVQSLEAFDSLQVSSLLMAAYLTMMTLHLCCLPILPQLLTQLCQLSYSLGSLVPSMRVCLTFGFLGMFRQSNLAPPSASPFESMRHLCKGDVILLLPESYLLSNGQKQFRLWAGHPSSPYPPSRTTQLTQWGLTRTSSLPHPPASSNDPLLTISASPPRSAPPQ